MDKCKDARHQQDFRLSIYEANATAFNLPRRGRIGKFDLHTFPRNVTAKKFAKVLSELAVLRVDSGVVSGK